MEPELLAIGLLVLGGVAIGAVTITIGYFFYLGEEEAKRQRRNQKEIDEINGRYYNMASLCLVPCE